MKINTPGCVVGILVLTGLILPVTSLKPSTGSPRQGWNGTETQRSQSPGLHPDTVDARSDDDEPLPETETKPRKHHHKKTEQDEQPNDGDGDGEPATHKKSTTKKHKTRKQSDSNEEETSKTEEQHEHNRRQTTKPPKHTSEAFSEMWRRFWLMPSSSYVMGRSGDNVENSPQQ